MEFESDGIKVNNEFFKLEEINKRCKQLFIEDNNIVLFSIEWGGTRGFPSGCYEHIAMPYQKAMELKNEILDQKVYFGEIAGKYSEIFGFIELKDMNIEKDTEKVLKFYLNHPSGYHYNYSFLDNLLENGELKLDIRQYMKEEV